MCLMFWWEIVFLIPSLIFINEISHKTARIILWRIKKKKK